VVWKGVLESALLDLVMQVPRGRITTYGALARALGDPLAVRWVKEELSKDLGLPSHRVVGDDFSLKGRGEIARKLKQEGVEVGKARGDPFKDFITSRPLERYSRAQLKLAEKVLLSDDLGRDYVAGIDVSYSGKWGKGACSIFELDGGGQIDEFTIVKEAKFPYIPTYLAFREGGLIIELVKMMAREERRGCVLLVDGHGIMHPRRCGLASHVGVVLNIPAIGIAKSCLLGEQRGGGWIYVDGARVGCAIEGGRYVSPGHMASVSGSIEFVRDLLKILKIDPLRRAHLASRRWSDHI
jgi:deoxyribonuclease V